MQEDRDRAIAVGLRERGPVLAVWAATIAYVCLASYFSLERHEAFRSAFDLANFDQALWLLAQGEEPFITQHGRNFFGDHFVPSMLLLVPIYVLGGGVSALLVLQSITIALVAPLLFVLARAYGAQGWVAVLPAVLWLASPLTLMQNLDDFHHIPVAAPLIVASIVALQKERLLIFAGLALLACGFKEDVALIYAMLGVVVFLGGKRRLGTAIGAAATAVFGFAVFVVMPHYSESLDWFAKRFAGDRGDSLSDVALWMTRNPIAAIEDTATSQNVILAAALVVTTGGLCLLAPRWMLLALPAFAHNILSAHPEQHRLWYHYQFPVMLGLAVAGAVGVSRLQRLRLVSVRRLVAVGVGLGIGLFPVGLVYADGSRHWSEEAKRYLGGPAARREALEVIPDGVPIAASHLLTPHLSQRQEIYTLPLPFVPVDFGGDLTPSELQERARRVRYVALELNDEPKELRRQREILPPLLERLGFREIGRFGSVAVYARGKAS